MSEVRHSVRVRCPVSHAFAVFTERVDAWWPPTHRRLRGSTLAMEPGPGGQLVERGPDGTILQLGEITAWEPPGLIGFAWRLGAPPDAPTSVRVRFTPDADATLVEVVHVEGPRPLPDWARTATLFDAAWRHVLAALQDQIPA